MRRHEHKSAKGCCICRCKSSTSRFAKSYAWEKFFSQCFLLPPNERYGDICNACVLVVKRFCKKKKKSTFEYVVDSRSGPGSKNMTKIKKQKTILAAQEIKTLNKKRKQNKNDIVRVLHQPQGLEIRKNSSEINKIHCYEDEGEDSMDLNMNWSEVFQSFVPITPLSLATHFTGYKVCCGILYHSEKTGEVLYLKDSYKPCDRHLKMAHNHLASLSPSPSSYSSSSCSSALPTFSFDSQSPATSLFPEEDDSEDKEDEVEEEDDSNESIGMKERVSSFQTSNNDFKLHTISQDSIDSEHNSDDKEMIKRSFIGKFCFQSRRCVSPCY